MSHIGIHGFAAGHREKGGAEDGEADVKVLVDQEIKGIKRTHGGEHARRSYDAADAKQCDRQEPGEHYRPEDPADEASAFPLHDEKPDQDDDGEWHDSRCQRRRIDLQAFKGAEHGDGRRDGAVAIEKRRADKADDQKLCAPRSGPGIAGGEQRQQRDDAAFAAVIGAQNQQRVFDRNDQDQRPEDQRHHPQDCLGAERPAMGGRLGRFLQRIQRAGADVAIDDAKGSERCRQWERAGID